MANRDGLAINQNANRNPNQNQNEVQGNVPDDNQGQNPPPHNPFLPNAPIVPQLNWSHFKPEYAGKLGEDTDGHLLRMNNWMDTHDFQDQVEVQ